jgi:two-component system, response regulator PdtaR
MTEQKFKILIIEDERLVAKDIAARLTQNGYFIAGIADNYEAAIALFNEHLPDLVLLDINIKGDKNGIDIATQINNTLSTPFIFVTAQTDAETLQKAKNTFPSAYLVKPFTTTHLLVSIDLALHNFAFQKKNNDTQDLQDDSNETLYTKQDFVFIKDSNCYIKINQNDVFMMESDGNYVRIYTHEKKYLIRCTINKAIEKMKQSYFVRVHRSFCVNINKVSKFNEQEITIENIKVPIGRNYKENFIKNFDLQ